MVLTYYASTIGTILAIPMVCHMQIPVFYLLRANSPSPPRHASTPTLWPHLYEYEYECPVLPPPSSMELVLMGSDSTLFSLPLLNLHLPSKCITVPLLTSFRIQLMIFIHLWDIYYPAPTMWQSPWNSTFSWQKHCGFISGFRIWPTSESQ
jgi:hypothetical protein